MIDFVHLKATYYVSETALISEWWRETESETGDRVFYHHQRGVVISYRPETGRWNIAGKLIALIYDTRVLNVDDVYGTDLQEFIYDINTYLQSLLTVPMLDVSDFEVLRIDYCFNICTPYVGEYLDVLCRAFKQTNTGNRINFTQEHRIEGSVYIKTKGDYKANTRRNYVLNYYDKSSRLEYQRMKGLRISPEDWKWAENVLRLEVQCGFQFIKKLCAKLSCSRCLGDLLTYQAAFYAHANIYAYVFKADFTQDFYSYQAAKRLLKNKSALKVLERSAEHHRIAGSQFARGQKIIRETGIYPFAFVQKMAGVEVLENPLRLIWNKMVEIGAVEGHQ